MKAAVCYEFGKPLKVEEVQLAETGAHEVRVRVAATAICHSDIHDIKGELPGPLPFVPGHECAGYVEETGPAVKGLKKGDPVVVSLLMACGECYYCRSGLPHLCQAKFAPPAKVRIRNANGNPINQKANVGGFSEFILVDESQLIRVPADMPLDRACLLSCGVTTGFGAVVKRTQVKAFQSVVILGAGGVGINAIQGAAFVGACPIIAVDTLDRKLEQAKQFGATHGVNAKSQAAIDEVKALTDGRGADYVYVTVGSIAAIRQGLVMAGPRGTIVLIGLPPVGQEFCFSPLELIPTEKHLVGGYMGSADLQKDIPDLISAYRSGRLKLDELIGGRYRLEDINEAIASSEKGESFRNVIMFG